MTSRRQAGSSERSTDPGEDLILLQRIAEGDRRAFDELFRSYHPRVIRFLYRITRSTETAEELFNDVMFVVWEKAADFRGHSRVSTWILGIAYRKALKAVSKARRLRSQRPLSELELQTLREPRSMADRRELRDWLGKALETLSDQQRMVIELAYFMGHSCAEIAEIAGCPVNTVKTRMFHARKRLREILPHLGAAETAPAAQETPP